MIAEETPILNPHTQEGYGSGAIWLPPTCQHPFYLRAATGLEAPESTYKNPTLLRWATFAEMASKGRYKALF